MSQVDYIAYAFFLTIPVVAFSGMGSIYLPTFLFGMMGIPKDEMIDIKSPEVKSFYWFWMFFIGLACHLSVIYIYMQQVTQPFDDPNGRYPAITTMSTLWFANAAILWAYSVYMFYNRDNYSNKALNVLFSPTTSGTNNNSYLNSTFDTSLGLFYLCVFFFYANLVIPIIYIYIEPFGWHGDAASIFLLVSMILIGVNGLLTFTTNPMIAEKTTYELIQEVDTNKNENFPMSIKARKIDPMIGREMVETPRSRTFEVPEGATQLGTLLKTGTVLSTPEIAMKLKDYKKFSGTVIGNGGQLYPKNSQIGALFHVIRNEMNEPNADVCIRHFNNNIIALKSSQAYIADNHFNDIHNGILNIRHAHPVGDRMVKKPLSDVDSSGKRFVFDKDYLDPVLKQPGAYSGITQPYVAFARDYDYMSNKVFIFFEDCFGLSHGVGIHVHFPKTVVGPFVIFMFPVYVYFLANSLYGFIAWLITTFLPYLIATHGTFTQFWPIYIMFSMVSWGLIYLVYPIVPSGANSYIYSDSTWSNAYFNNTVCPGECTSLDESSTYYALCLTSFLVALINFMVTIAEKAINGFGYEGAILNIPNFFIRSR